MAIVASLNPLALVGTKTARSAAVGAMPVAVGAAQKGRLALQAA